VTVTRTVVPGDWYGVLGDDVIVLLPPEARSRVAGLWEVVEEGAGFDEVLDAVIGGGLRGLAAFVLVSRDGREVKVVIRGAGEAELTTADGVVTVSGSAETTWVERNLTGVTGLRVRVGDDAGRAYAIGSGLVRVARVEDPAAAVVAQGDAPAVAVPIESRAPEPEPPARILPPDPQLDAEKQPEPAPPPEVPGETLPVAAAPGAPAPVPDALGIPGFDPLTSPDLAVTPGDRSGGSAVAETGPEPPPGATSRPVARLVFSSGDVVDVDRAVVVGRAPEHGRFGGDGQTRLVTVPSPHQEISSTHLEVRPGSGADHGSAVVTDLGSTNGTVVVQPGLPAEDLRPGIGVALVPGATIDLGEGVTIQVTQA
jgi:hypothetical protein